MISTCTWLVAQTRVCRHQQFKEVEPVSHQTRLGWRIPTEYIYELSDVNGTRPSMWRGHM